MPDRFPGELHGLAAISHSGVWQMAKTLSEPDILGLTELLATLMLKHSDDGAHTTQRKATIAAIATITEPWGANPVILEPVIQCAFVACTHDACLR